MLNNNKSYAVYASTISLLMSLTAVSASAEEARNPLDAETNQIDEIIVSATGMPTPASQIGVSMDVITAEDIARQQIRLLPNILSKNIVLPVAK